jgi:Flp pilus assembly pilin Flp
MQNLLIRFMADRRGATAIEYALIATFLSIVVAAAVTALGQQMYALLGNATAAIH